MDRAKYMSAEEVRQLRTTTEARAVLDLRDGRVGGVLRWMVVDLALSTGLRVSELARIGTADLDLKRGCLTVTRSKKRKVTQETLAIGTGLVKHLRDYTAGRDGAERLFVGERGPLTVQGLQQAWKRAIQLAGLPRELSIHCARHTLAVHLLKKTGNLRQVQKQLGHSSPTITAAMYADVTFEDMQDGVNGIWE